MDTDNLEASEISSAAKTVTQDTPRDAVHTLLFVSRNGFLLLSISAYAFAGKLFCPREMLFPLLLYDSGFWRGS